LRRAAALTPNLTETASGLPINGGKVLLGFRSSWNRFAAERWDAIGGHLEPGETPETALVREFEEDVGLTATGFRLMASLPEPRPDLNGGAIHHVFAVKAWTGGEPANVSDEHSEIRWFTPEEVVALSNTPDFDFAHPFRLALT
jgi:8-oxo-dGTP diphosphatase